MLKVKRNSLLMLASLAIAWPVFGHLLPVTAKANDVTVAPFLQTVTLSPGDAQKSFELSITNNLATVQNLKLSVTNFGSLDETGGIAFAGSNANKLMSKYGLADWLSLSDSELSLSPHQTAKVTATIDNQSSLSPGGHYAAIIASSVNNGQGSGSQVSINQKVSSLVFATKIGGEKYDLHLNSISSDRTVSKLPKTVTLSFKNTGNTQLVPRGIVYLMSGNTFLSRGVINEQSSYVLPETNRIFDIPLKPIAASPKYIVGSFKIKVDYRYDGYDKFASRSQSFKLFSPLSLLIIIVFIVGLIFVLKKYPLKRKTKKAK
jgi:hypothetical protein